MDIAQLTTQLERRLKPLGFRLRYVDTAAEVAEDDAVFSKLFPDLFGDVELQGEQQTHAGNFRHRDGFSANIFYWEGEECDKLAMVFSAGKPKSMTGSLFPDSTVLPYGLSQAASPESGWITRELGSLLGVAVRAYEIGFRHNQVAVERLAPIVGTTIDYMHDNVQRT